ncbi:DNA-binding MarR family transcriptional regulator [Cryobacterium mesophilum]|uniref:MarR family transcriptional regulator n=1 Tax=Terrimesophilobacter mesophilus TaxID=433647 RepID=A0A4R8VEL0_9MICO|nr:MarR family transcriptional regulator [Terrimesophilobacter mesophilus]MBB5633937.1 DNA-binding MarR family transcriptional regulator [Terrimesophilobacter mesophilus]TFB80602.1 MarR family transcriptional regulator [Terrimesophilobacter mesophilus]
MSAQKNESFRWLNDEEQAAWRAYLTASARLQQQLDRDLQQNSGMPHAYYMILAMLSEAPDRGMRMTDLAELLSSSPSRLSHAIRKLVELDWIRKDADADDGRVTWACLTDEGMRVLVEAAPGHVTTVVESLFDRLTPTQVAQLREISTAMLQD